MSWGTPGLKLKGKFLARLKEDGESLVLRIGFETRERLMRTSPDVFYITDHYAGYPAVLVRLPKVGKRILQGLLREAWSEVASEIPLDERRLRGRGDPKRGKAR